MNKQLLSSAIFSALFLFSLRVFGQNFNLDTYKSFLEANQNLSYEQLIEKHSAGSFGGNLNVNFNNAHYSDSISVKLNLTEFEKSLLNKHGFMVSERLNQNSFGSALLDIYHHDLPVFVSTDAILHTVHKSYDDILKAVEVDFLIDKIKTLLEQLHAKLPELEQKYQAKPEMQIMLRDVDVYLTVPRLLLGESIVPYYSDNMGKIDTILQMIASEQGFVSCSIFSDNPVIQDWSQFKPRGHYTDEGYPELADYFRTMMWLGRIEIYLLSPQATTDQTAFNDLKRQTIDAFLIKELFDLTNAYSIYNEIEDVLRFFVGESDNVTLSNLLFLEEAINLTNAGSLLDSLKLIEFQDTLKNQSFAYQLILSQILLSDPFSPDSIVPASVFLLFGQRFIIDSYVTGSVVYDRIKYNGGKICRLFPSSLDPMFALGNDAAAQLLESELHQYKYSTNLAALRYLIDSYGMDFWTGTLYNLWLNSIRKLNPPSERNSLPAFMQTGAYWQKQLNTQLTSWTQLRHDNLLYAKQSYTGGVICSFPYSFVEPFPEFYENLKIMAQAAQAKFRILEFGNDYLKENILEYYSNLYSISDTLSVISLKELNNQPLNEGEKNFLKSMISVRYGQVCGDPPVYNGWYPRLFYDLFHGDKLTEADFIVADIHTTPTDCFGETIGAITHVGTGPVNLGVFLAEYEGELIAFTGPVFSYYEYRTYNFLRLTDEEWSEEHLSAALRPSWVNLYLANSTGGSRGEGINLLTSVEGDTDLVLPKTYLVAGNYPNPFNPSTIIYFTIPADVNNELTELKIYDIKGELIKSLISEMLPSGNYVVRWDGVNETNTAVTSGIYIYNLRVGEKHLSGKMTLIK